jgi:hypothetical protein
MRDGRPDDGRGESLVADGPLPDNGPGLVLVKPRIMPLRHLVPLLAALVSGCSVVATVGDVAVTTAGVVVKTGVNAAGTAADVGMSAVRTVAHHLP